ncbi:MAG: ErfK/YbiS/YcfS/YnhG family protein [Hyphomicrobiales bacterium]|nr:ErfK/YbiS/YcfS/YnhG family protein [Hyphomicrobiales bacterium]
MRSIRKSACVVAAMVAFTVSSGAARAELLIKVDQSTQRMVVAVDGAQLYEWPVSTGRPGFETPRGNFRPNRMDADHYSQEYDQAPMPYAIFFDLNGHAIHGSFDPIGRPAASHGCVRLAPANAAKLFALVAQQKMGNTKVEISGDVQVALRNMKSIKTARAAREPEAPPTGELLIVAPDGSTRILDSRASQNPLYGLY